MTISVANWREKTESSRMFTLLKRWKIDSSLNASWLLGDVEDDQAALAQLLGDLRLRGRLELAAGGNPGEVDRAEGEGAHRSPALPQLIVGAASGPIAAPLPGPSRRSPSRRLSSSGTAARCSASARVILPVRTSDGQVRVHRLHPDRAGGLQRGVDLVGLALADQVADRRGRDQDLGRARRGPRRRPSGSAAG